MFNRKKKHNINALDIVAALIIFLLLSISETPAQLSPSFKQAEKLESEEPEAQEEPKRIERSKVEYTALRLRDPFKSYIEVEVADDERGIQGQETQGTVNKLDEVKISFNLVIQGLIWGGRFPQAIINNQVVKEGDLINIDMGEQARIISIDKEGVIISYKEIQYEISSPAMESMPIKEPGTVTMESMPIKEPGTVNLQ